MRKCRQCGETKPLTEDNYRKYYKGSGYYRTCKTCESINNRYKYLVGKGDTLSEGEIAEKASIEELYELLGTRKPVRHDVGSVVAEMLKKQRRRVAEREEIAEKVGMEVSTDTPDELLEWLQRPLDDFEPDYLLDDVYESLVSRHRPVVGLDEESMLPIYDDTHREVLNKILERFNEHEEGYYG